MIAQESAALERAIAAAQSHPIVLLSVPSSKRAEAEREIRRIARDGLTAREAHRISAALDTDAERRKVVDILAAIVPTPDAAILVRWLLAEVKRALAVAPPSVSVVDTPAATMAWRERLKRPMLFFSAPNYYWQEASPSEVCDAILAAGLDGPSIELNGSTVVHDYIRQPDLRRMDAIMREQIDAWAAWDKAIRARGLVAHIAFLNSNNSKANSVSDAQWQAFAEAFAGRYGADNKIVLPLSETDSRTRASVGKSIFYGLRNTYPAEQLIGYGKSPWGRYTETHRERRKVEAGSRWLLQVTDNAPAIRDLYGAKWTMGGEPNLDHIRDFARRIRAAGTSGAVYSFGRSFDFAGCRAAGEVWGAVVAPPVTPDAPAAAGLTFSQGPHKRSVKWSPIIDRSGWREGPQAECNGLLYGCKVGGTPRKVEHIKTSRDWTWTKNAFADAGPKYSQGWQSGDRVLLQVRDAFGKLREPWHQGEYILP